MSAVGVNLVAYGFQKNLFPIFESLHVKTTHNALKSTGIGILIACALYISLGILSLYVFGSGVASSVLSNLDDQTTIASYVIRATFMLVIACHIPYNFISGKESLLIMVEEIRRRSMSEAIDSTLNMAVMCEMQGKEYQASNLASFLQIETWLYVVLSMGLYCATLAAACVIKDISIIFGFVGAFAQSAIEFTMPGMFYLITDTKYSVNHSVRRKMSVFYICLGVGISFFLLTAEVI
jgi:amino acid permease